MKKLLGITFWAGCALFSFTAAAQKTPQLFGQEITSEDRNPENNLIRCATTQYEKYLQSTDEKRATEQEFENWLNPLIEQQRLRNMTQSQADGVTTIPVVVHVIHNGQEIGVAPNITDAQVISQITVLNQDFRRMSGTPGFNNSAVGADTQIQFALAKQDPNGMPTNGINRVNLCQDAFGEQTIQSIVKPSTIWDPTQYLNIWVMNFGGDLADVLGYAQFPSNAGLPGLSANGGSQFTDGVALSYKFFGSVAFNDGTFLLEAPYNRGRTATHEVGHYLGLRHIWGDSYCGNDYCNDTPQHHGPNDTCNTTKQNCTSNGFQMVQNYMDYTTDTCMNIFTADQKLRMQTVLNNATRRSTLKTSTKDQAIALFANDAELKESANCADNGNSPGCDIESGAGVALQLTNRGTATITSAVITIAANGQTATYNYSGNLVPHASAEFIVNADFSGPYTYTVTTVNGTADQRPANNQGTAAGSVFESAPTVNESNIVFELTTDRFGSETQWELVNSAGATIATGGPYTNVTATQWSAVPRVFNFNLEANECYTLTIEDSYSDGICCDYMQGGFVLKTASGVIISPFAGSGQFGSSTSRTFHVSALSTATFEQSAIYLYPNPGKDVVSIRMANAFDNVAVKAHTLLGQQMPVDAQFAGEEIVLNTSSWANGVYFIQVQVGESTKTMRFVKQ